jgi:hypothetical protein
MRHVSSYKITEIPLLQCLTKLRPTAYAAFENLQKVIQWPSVNNLCRTSPCHVLLAPNSLHIFQ